MLEAWNISTNGLKEQKGMSPCHRFLPEEMGDKLRLVFFWLVSFFFLAEVLPKSKCQGDLLLFAFQIDDVPAHILCTYFSSLVGEIPKATRFIPTSEVQCQTHSC